MNYGGENHLTADQGCVWLFGCGSKPGVALLGLYHIGCTPALSVTWKRRCSCSILLVALYKCYMHVPLLLLWLYSSSAACCRRGLNRIPGWPRPVRLGCTVLRRHPSIVHCVVGRFVMASVRRRRRTPIDWANPNWLTDLTDVTNRRTTTNEAGAPAETYH